MAFPCSEILKFDGAEEALAVVPEEESFGAMALVALLATVTAPEMLPVDCGANPSSTVTVCPAAIVAEELLPTMENPLPETLSPEIVRAAVPVSVNVTVCVALLPTATLPKSTEFVLAERMLEPEAASDVLLAALVV